MGYIGIPRGIFIVQEEKDTIEKFKEKIKSQLNIDLAVVSDQDLGKIKNILSEFFRNKTINNTDISIWQYSYNLENSLLQKLSNLKKTNKGKKCYDALWDYYFTINNRIFFKEIIIEKTNELYNTYKTSPNISAKCGHELIGEPFEDNYDRVPDEIFKETFSDPYSIINISTFIEHKARLAVLKTAIDYLLNKNNVDIDTYIEEDWMLAFQPDNFKNWLNTISTHKYFYRYPVFWQWFMWVFGGFILEDCKDEEYKFLSQKTGIPVEEIENALNAYDILFPTSGGWFSRVNASISNIREIKMFPVPFKGIGVEYRRLIYTESGKLEELGSKLNGKYTLDDLKKWHNCLKALNNKNSL